MLTLTTKEADGFVPSGRFFAAAHSSKARPSKRSRARYSGLRAPVCSETAPTSLPPARAAAARRDCKAGIKAAKLDGVGGSENGPAVTLMVDSDRPNNPMMLMMPRAVPCQLRENWIGSKQDCPFSPKLPLPRPLWSPQSKQTLVQGNPVGREARRKSSHTL